MEFVLAKIDNLWKFLKKHYLLLSLLILIIPSTWDLLKPGFFPMHDDLQIFRLQQVDKCFKDFQIPCQWVPDGGFGYGYPLMQFYPPMPYYPMEILNLLGVGMFNSVKIMFALSFLVSGVGIYLLAKKFFGGYAALLSSVLYVYSPYHSVDIYVRGAMNEGWGMAWFPFILYYIHELITKPKSKRAVIGLSLFLSLQLTSHNVMTMVFAPSAIIWALFWIIRTKKKDSILKLIYAGLLGVGLSSFFFIPVVLEQKYVHVDSMIVGYFNYLAHFADIKQLFLSNFWGYGGSTWGPEDGMSFSIGYAQWSLAVLSSIVAIINYKKQKTLSFMIILSTFFAFCYAYLTHSKSSFFWNHLKLLQFSQFPWRLVALSVFYFSFAGSYFVTVFQKSSLYKLLVISLSVGIIAYNISYFRVDRHLRVTIAEKLSGLSWENQVTGGIFDYLPRSAKMPPGSPAPNYPFLIDGKGGILNYQKGTNWQNFQVRATEDATVIVPLYNYPNTVITINKQVVDSQSYGDLGLVSFSVPNGLSFVKIAIKNTPIRTISNIISLASLSIFLLLTTKYGRRKLSQ